MNTMLVLISLDVKEEETVNLPETMNLTEKIKSLLGSSVRVKRKQGSPLMVVQKHYPSDTTTKAGEPHPYAGETIERGVAQIGTGKYGLWFKTCTVDDNGKIKEKGRGKGKLVNEKSFDEWTLVE